MALLLFYGPFLTLGFRINIAAIGLFQAWVFVLVRVMIYFQFRHLRSCSYLGICDDGGGDHRPPGDPHPCPQHTEMGLGLDAIVIILLPVVLQRVLLEYGIQTLIYRHDTIHIIYQVLDVTMKFWYS